jgi:hypothetical protein
MTVMSHVNHTIMPNNTIRGGKIAHVGQIYFDQELLDEVQKIPPYSQNKQSRTRNSHDFIMRGAVHAGFDPVVEYMTLGNSLQAGIFAWINFGIDTGQNHTVLIAAECSDTGCTPKPITFGGMGFPKGFGDLFGSGGKGMGSLGSLLNSLFPSRRAKGLSGSKKQKTGLASETRDQLLHVEEMLADFDGQS